MLKKKLSILFNLLSNSGRRIKNFVSPFPGTWTHIFVKRQGATVYIYLNNTVVISGTLTGKPIELDSDNRIGLSHFDSNALQGELKLFEYYNYALDDTERTDKYNEELV